MRAEAAVEELLGGGAGLAEDGVLVAAGAVDDQAVGGLALLVEDPDVDLAVVGGFGPQHAGGGLAGHDAVQRFEAEVLAVQRRGLGADAALRLTSSSSD